MDPTFQHRVIQVLGDALDLAPAERAGFLDTACAEDATLRAEVERLLAGDRIAAAAIPTAHGADAFAKALLPPAQIGPYRLVRPLGEGGMGVVYLAMQQTPVRRTVALKLIRPGMDSREVVARFESERQALALMNHPNVAQVFDAGTTDAGRPYFVMEYVEGEPITAWCDKNRASQPTRLELFLQVCDAVQHAHQKGIVHRDLKPTNVLITLREGTPLPKVIDFGIAKAIEQKLGDQATVTEHGQMVGTPEYMSPEQAAQDGVDVDTRTDVYSLGVLLYELMAGVLPFDSKMLRSSAFDEMRRLIREADPQRPSVRLSVLDADRQSDIATARATDSVSLRRALKGDLDWITMKALEKDRERRYSSPADLSADLQRHLRFEPVLAGPPTAGYRASKFVRRHRTAVVAASIVLIALVAGIATTTWQAVRALRAERLARHEQQLTLEQKTLAEKRFAELRKLAGSRLFEVDDTLQSSGPTKAREKLISVATEYLDALAKESPDAALKRELIEGYLRVGSVQFYPGVPHLGDPTGALATYQKALDIAKSLRDAAPSDAPASMMLAGCWVYLAEAQAELLQTDDAFASFANAKQVYERLAAASPKSIRARRNVALVLEKTGYLQQKLGRAEEALEAKKQCLQLYQAVLVDAPDDAMVQRDVGLAHSALASLLLDMGHLGESLDESNRALQIAQKRSAREPDNPLWKRDVDLERQRAAETQLAMGHGPLAASLAREILAAYLAGARADSSDFLAKRDLAGAYATLGDSLISCGKTIETIDAYRNSIRLRTELLQQNPTDLKTIRQLAHAHRGLAAALRDAGNPNEALAEAHAARQIHEDRATKEPDNRAVDASLSAAYGEIAQSLVDTDRLPEAIEYFKKAYDVRARRQAPDSDVDARDLAPVLVWSADAHRRAGLTQDAIKLNRDVIRLCGKALKVSPEDDASRRCLAMAQAQLGEILLESGEPDEAAPLIAQALKTAAALAANPACGTEAKEALLTAQLAQAELLEAKNQPADAAAIFASAQATARELSALDPDNIRLQKIGSPNQGRK
ncbi:MAG: protein kinase domain-containing protein [Tepidisphaeraceae bacterium]